MQVRVFKYLSPFITYLGALVAFGSHGWIVWLPLIYAWFIIPLLELFIPANAGNLSEAEEELARLNIQYEKTFELIVSLEGN